MRRDQAPKSNVDLTRKAMSVENINKLKPVLMKNINLNQKVRKYQRKISNILRSVKNEGRIPTLKLSRNHNMLQYLQN